MTPPGLSNHCSSKEAASATGSSPIATTSLQTVTPKRSPGESGATAVTSAPSSMGCAAGTSSHARTAMHTSADHDVRGRPGRVDLHPGQGVRLVQVVVVGLDEGPDRDGQEQYPHRIEPQPVRGGATPVPELMHDDGDDHPEAAVHESLREALGREPRSHLLGRRLGARQGGVASTRPRTGTASG